MLIWRGDEQCAWDKASVVSSTDNDDDDDEAATGNDDWKTWGMNDVLVQQVAIYINIGEKFRAWPLSTAHLQYTRGTFTH